MDVDGIYEKFLGTKSKVKKKSSQSQHKDKAKENGQLHSTERQQEIEKNETHNHTRAISKQKSLQNNTKIITKKYIECRRDWCNGKDENKQPVLLEEPAKYYS